MRVEAYDTIKNGITPINFNPVCDSTSNLYIPMFAFFTGTVLTKGRKKVIIYSPFINEDVNCNYARRNSNTGGKFFESIITGKHIYVDVYTQRYYIYKHCVYQIDNNFNVKFLFVLCLDKNYFFSIKSIHSKLDNSGLLLIVSSDLDKDEHKSLRFKFNKYVRDYMQGIDTLVTNDIDKYCFQNSLKTVKFKNVIERVEYINNLKNNFDGQITS